jgi:cbb3-type cytochrome c oxidase subunit III
MARPVILMLACLAAAVMNVGAPASGLPPARQGNAEAKKIKNPIPSDAASIEEGRKIYARNCASCHGPGGKGDGSMALGGSTPADLTDDKWDHGSSDGEIFVVIRDGVSADMEGYRDKLSEKQIWQVINYIRSLGPKPEKKG